MRYYVVADIHGFYTELYNALAEKGFFTDTEPHKLIVCGDLFDRGKEAVKVQSFIFDLMERDEVILIRGNHEDLTLCLIQDWENFGYMQSHHISNGTVDTVLQLTGNEIVVWANARAIKNELLNTPFIEDIIPKMLDYYETKNYLYTLKIGDKPVYIPAGGLSEKPYGTLFGRPVVPIEQCSAAGEVGDIILADIGQYLLIDKGGIKSASSIHVRFLYDENVFRFIYRVDGKPIWTKPLTPYKGSATVSPFVTLAKRGA